MSKLDQSPLEWDNRVAANVFLDNIPEILKGIKRRYRKLLEIEISEPREGVHNIVYRKLNTFETEITYDNSFRVNIALSLKVDNVNEVDGRLNELREIVDLLNIRAKELGGSLNIERSIFRTLNDEPFYAYCNIDFYFRSDGVDKNKSDQLEES